MWTDRAVIRTLNPLMNEPAMGTDNGEMMYGTYSSPKRTLQPTNGQLMSGQIMSGRLVSGLRRLDGR